MESSLQRPYEVVKNKDWDYSFQTKHGIIYHAYFIEFSNYHPAFSDVYTFNIEPEADKPHPLDVRISVTVVSILQSFFRDKQRAMLMVCDSLDGKEEKRKNLFDRWFKKYNDGNIRKYDASAVTEDYTIYVSIYLHRANPRSHVLLDAFYDLVKNDFYPID